MNPSQLTRLQKFEPLIVAVLMATFYYTQSLSSVMEVGAFNDDGVYAALGKAIADGRGYLSIHLVGAPVHPKFPPVFPLILALLWKLTGSIQGVQRMVALIHPVVIGVSAAILWWVGTVKFKVSRALVAACVIPMLLFDSAVQYYTIPLSEPWFILGCSVTILCYRMAVDADDRPRVKWIALMGFLAALTILVRSQGIALVPGFALALSRRDINTRQRIAGLAALILPLAAWYAYHFALLVQGPRSNLPDDITYDTWMRLGLSVASLIAIIASNTLYYIMQFGSYFSATPIVGRTIASVLFSSMAVASLVVAKRAPMTAIPVLAESVMVFLWPFAQDRLLLSILPFAGLALAVAISPLMERYADRVRRVASIAAAAIVIAFVSVQTNIRALNIASFTAGAYPATFSPGFMLLVNSRFIAEASAWVRANTRRNVPRSCQQREESIPGRYRCISTHAVSKKWPNSERVAAGPHCQVNVSQPGGTRAIPPVAPIMDATMQGVIISGSDQT